MGLMLTLFDPSFALSIIKSQPIQRASDSSVSAPSQNAFPKTTFEDVAASEWRNKERGEELQTIYKHSEY